MNKPQVGALETFGAVIGLITLPTATAGRATGESRPARMEAAARDRHL
jgi:hypothetical protein